MFNHAAGEMLHMAEPFLEKNVHPTVIVRGYVRALEDAIQIVDELSFPIDTNDKAQMLKIVNSCIGTKFTNQFGNLMAVSIHRVLSTMSRHHADPACHVCCSCQVRCASLAAQCKTCLPSLPFQVLCQNGLGAQDPMGS